MKFRHKPIEIEAIQFTYENLTQISKLIRESWWVNLDSQQGSLSIETRLGTVTAQVGDWIVRGVDGLFYPCKKDVFEATYEQI